MPGLIEMLRKSLLKQKPMKKGSDLSSFNSETQDNDLKLIVEAEILQDTLKLANARVVKLINYDRQSNHVSNMRQLEWSRDMLSNKIGKQIQTIRILLLSSKFK